MMHRHWTERILLAVAVATLGLISVRTARAQQPPRIPLYVDTTMHGRMTGTIDGIVSDSNLVPIHAAFVSIVGTPIRIGTGPNGRFRIVKVPVGQYLVIVKRVGYHPVSSTIEVSTADTVRLAYTLNPVTATELSPVVVSEPESQSLRLKGFDERRKLGFGEFMTRAEIEKAASVYPTELMRHFLAINVSPNRNGAVTEYYALSTREGGNPQQGACPMQVYLDEVPLETPFNLDLLPPPKDIYGIEVYSGAATIPPRFAGTNTGCGVILVWTKSGA